MRLIGRTEDGAVVVDRHNSHLHECAGDSIIDALKQINTKGRQFIEAEIDLRRFVGGCICVDTTPEDIIVFAQRPNRRGLTRFVMDREPVPTNKMMVILKKSDKPREYILITAFAGGKSELEPWDSRATEASRVFWKSKALIWDGQVVDGTATGACPWNEE